MADTDFCKSIILLNGTHNIFSLSSTIFRNIKKKYLLDLKIRCLKLYV